MPRRSYARRVCLAAPPGTTVSSGLQRYAALKPDRAVLIDGVDRSAELGQDVGRYAESCLDHPARNNDGVGRRLVLTHPSEELAVRRVDIDPRRGRRALGLRDEGAAKAGGRDVRPSDFEIDVPPLGLEPANEVINNLSFSKPHALPASAAPSRL